jgi:hypothetical protein
MAAQSAAMDTTLPLLQITERLANMLQVDRAYVDG